MLELCFAISMHFALGDGWNERHLAVRYVADDFTIGAYYNSEFTTSFYVSHTFEYEQWFAEVGAVTGYSGADVLPMVRLGWEVQDSVSIFASPAYADGNIGMVIGVEMSMRKLGG